MRILHIIKEIKDRRPLEMAEIQKEQGNDVALLLIHDAVLTVPDNGPDNGIKAFACQDDVTARGVNTDAELVGYDEIVRLVFAYDSVACW